MVTIILCTVIWLISLYIFGCTVKYYDDLNENFEEDFWEIKYVRRAAVIMFIFQLLCFLNILSAIEKW